MIDKNEIARIRADVDAAKKHAEAQFFKTWGTYSVRDVAVAIVKNADKVAWRDLGGR